MRRARLRGQLLGDRAPSPDAVGAVDEVVGALVGVQAQDVTAAGLAVRARCAGVVADDVERAREDRRVVLTWSLRGTRHLHLASDVRWLVGVLGPAHLRPSRRAEVLGIAGAAGDRAVAALVDALAGEGPLTRNEVKDRLARCGVDPSGQAPIHVVARAALEGLVAVIPGERYVLLDDWLGPSNGASPGPGELARRYLGTFGPATAADFSAWSGLGAAAARREWQAVAADLVEVVHPSGPSWMLAAHADEAEAAATARSPGRVRLLGAFDSLLLAYADRRVHLDPEHVPLVNAGGGILKPLVTVDGRVVGTWSRARGRVEVHPFRALAARASSALARETADVGRFLAPG